MLLAIRPLLQNRLGPYLYKLKRQVKTGFKGSFLNLSLYLGVFLVVLFGILSFKPGVILGPVKNPLSTGGENSLFAASAGSSLRESPDITFFQGNTLVGVSPPVTATPQVLGSLLGEAEPEDQKEITEYIVEPGDTLSSIASKFGISLETLLWANDLSKNSKIKPGQKLVILPVSGVIYHVKKGDTLSEIAKTYKGKVEEIIAFNELSGEGDIFIGDILVIPDGVIPPKPKPAPIQYTPLANSYFICPISPPCKLTQGLHWYNAVDFGGKCGDPIYAAAGGEVTRVKYGYNQGAGNYLEILHPNGVVTNYGHIAASLVNPGEQVSQGQIIGLIGGKPGTPGAGKSTGCHLHFGVKGARNPFAR